MHILSQREIHSNEIKQYIFGCIALGWLYNFMLLHKEIERLKINTYSWLPHFWLLALMIDYLLHHLLHSHSHQNHQWRLAIQDENQGVPNWRLCDIWWIIRIRAHVQFQRHWCFNESGFESWPFGCNDIIHSTEITYVFQLVFS